VQPGKQRPFRGKRLGGSKLVLSHPRQPLFERRSKNRLAARQLAPQQFPAPIGFRVAITQRSHGRQPLRSGGGYKRKGCQDCGEKWCLFESIHDWDTSITLTVQDSLSADCRAEFNAPRASARI
jgi:hypothetical protein